MVIDKNRVSNLDTYDERVDLDESSICRMRVHLKEAQKDNLFESACRAHFQIQNQLFPTERCLSQVPLKWFPQPETLSL